MCKRKTDRTRIGWSSKKLTASFLNFFNCLSIWSRNASSSLRSNFTPRSPLIFSRSFLWTSSWTRMRQSERDEERRTSYMYMEFLHTIIDILRQLIASVIKIFFQYTMIQISFIRFLRWRNRESKRSVFLTAIQCTSLPCPIHWSQRFYPLCFDLIVGLTFSMPNRWSMCVELSYTIASEHSHRCLDWSNCLYWSNLGTSFSIDRSLHVIVEGRRANRTDPLNDRSLELLVLELLWWFVSRWFRLFFHPTDRSSRKMQYQLNQHVQ